MTSTAAQIAAAGTPGRDSLCSLFDPRGIAVVGASRRPGKLGAALARSLAGFTQRGGHLALVNSRDETMYPSVRAAAGNGPVDLVMICVPAAACAGVLAEAAGAGARAAVVCGGGFAEAGGPGAEYQADLARVAGQAGVRLLGPNTSGFLAPHAGLSASFVPGTAQVRPGSIAVVAASGGVNHALSFLLTEADHGISLAVGLGNAVDIRIPDVLDYLAEDPHTGAVALHVESVADGPRLVRAIARLTEHRPVVALVVGRHDVGAFAASHTGALATSWRATRAALAQAGAVVVDDERDLVDAVGALATTRAHPGAPGTPAPGVGVVTAQAGPGLLLLDDLRGRRARVPELDEPTQRTLGTLLPPLTFQHNPVDTGRPGPELGEIFAAVAADPAIDMIAGYALHEPDTVDLVAAATRARSPAVPIVLGVGGTAPEVSRTRRALRAAGIAAVAEPRGVAAATGALLADARARGRISRHRQQQPVPAGITGPHDEHRAKLVLDRLGITTPQRRVCASRDEAHAALAELTTPVAVKLLDARVLHKTEAGGVHLDVATPDDLEAALDGLEAIGARAFLLESMAPPGIDLVLGARRDPVFGPVVVFGLGGILAEALADVVIRLAPLTGTEAAEMPDELAGRELLRGWRGGPTLNPTQLGRIVAALGDLLVANPGLDAVEVNPLRLTPDGLTALDAVLLAHQTHPDSSTE
jgi:acetyltransferase